MAAKNAYLLAPGGPEQEATVVYARSEKEGHKCCGGCCDVRRAVVIVNLVSIGVVFFGLLGVLFISKGFEMYDDDSTKQVLNEATKNVPVTIVLAEYIVQAVGSVFAIYGAVMFHDKMVMVGAVCYAALTLSSLSIMSIGDALLYGFFAYPHVFLVKEIRSGIMTPENYPNEVQSCCCV